MAFARLGVLNCHALALYQNSLIAHHSLMLVLRCASYGCTLIWQCQNDPIKQVGCLIHLAMTWKLEKEEGCSASLNADELTHYILNNVFSHNEEAVAGLLFLPENNFVKEL